MQDIKTGTFHRYPDLTGRRQAEGGARLRDDVIRSGPGPRVTLLTVCWNAEKTLEQMLASVAAQSYGNFEHLVVDGASTDRTVEILKAHAHQLDYYVSEPDQGLYFAMNKALELARGDYILFLNSDDWYDPETIEKLVAFQEESGADFVSSLANYVDESGRFERVQPYSPFDAGVEFRMPLRHETMLVPGEIYDTVGGYDTRYRIIADRVFTAGLYWRGYRHGALDEPLLNFRTTGTSSVDLDKLYAERARALAERFPGLSPQALRDLADLERITPARLLEISRITRCADFRAAAVDYALDREAQGHKAWQDINVDAFSPVLRKTGVIKPGARVARADLAAQPRPKVSVILPIYNAEDMLADSIESVLAQSLTDFELICLNDQTPDGSQAIVDDYVARDARVMSRINEINVGLGTSRNRGIALARGAYVFHIDPDDVIPPDALEKLVAVADEHRADMVRGAFVHEQMFQGQAAQSTRKGLPEGAAPIVNATLRDHPEFLHSTEGHWSYLYRADFAKRVFYPEDLKMGQDSIFLTHALTAARSICVIPDVVYHYRANANSAMNVYNFRKYMDEIEWRARAWDVLDRAGLRDLGDHLLCSYWNLPFFETLNARFDAGQKTRFWRRLRQVFARAENTDLAKTANPTLRQVMAEKLGHFARLPAVKGAEQPLRIEVIATSDHGGAGGAARRSVDGLRAAGHQARLHCLFAKSDVPHIWPLPLKPAHHAALQEGAPLHKNWQRMAVLTHHEHKGLKARELFSKTGSLTDMDTLRATLAGADVIHLHWTSGVLDMGQIADLVGDTPVVWTLHDMNPMTGGCHYSEGCEAFRSDCADCPLTGDSDLAQQALGAKQKALAALPNLRVIAPSDWLAEHARNSAVFAGRDVAMIPNIFPSRAFQPDNKLLARRALGLPLDRRLVLFGADNLGNRRKGGDLLKQALTLLKTRHQAAGVEVVVFGNADLALDLPVHSMGYVEDPARLAQIYAAADVFVFPSREDNAPQTVIEAMLAGTPVVGFEVGNVPQLVDHKTTGYLAAYEDAGDLARGVHWALEGTGKAALERSLACHLAARAHNDPDRAIDQHLALYRDMMKQPERDRPLRYGVLGASTSEQNRHHATGDITGYSEFLRVEYSGRIGSTPEQVRRFCYAGNRLSDGGLLQLQALCEAQPDICLFEPLVEDGTRGRIATAAEIHHVYGRLLRAGIVPITCFLPLPVGRERMDMPHAKVAQAFCQSHNLPLFIADIDAVLAQGGTFNGVHTTPSSARLIADQLASFIETLDLEALQARVAKLDLLLPENLFFASQPLPEQPYRHLKLCLRPKTDAPYRFRLVQAQEVGPHSGIVATRILQGRSLVQEQSLSVWDRHCHYSRSSFVVLCRDDTAHQGDLSIEVSLSPEQPDYASCPQKDILWPAPENMALHPKGPLYVLSDTPLELRLEPMRSPQDLPRTAEFL